MSLSQQTFTRSRPFIRRAVLSALCTLALLGSAFAQNQATDAPSKPESTRIELDERAGTVRIVVDGAERAVFDADGLHLSGNIAYTGTLTDISDGRLKTDIRPLPNQAPRLQALRPVAFGMADDPAGRTEYGLIAQEVAPVYPALVETRPGGAKAVNYAGLIAPLIAAVQDLQADNARLRARVEALEAVTGRTPAETEAR